MSNKLEQRALNQINQIDEGIFKGFLEKLISGRLKKQLKALEKDPQLKASFERFEKSVQDLEHDVETFSKIAAEADKNDDKGDYSSARRIKLYKSLGLL